MPVLRIRFEPTEMRLSLFVECSFNCSLRKNSFMHLCDVITYLWMENSLWRNVALQRFLVWSTGGEMEVNRKGFIFTRFDYPGTTMRVACVDNIFIVGISNWPLPPVVHFLLSWFLCTPCSSICANWFTCLHSYCLLAQHWIRGVLSFVWSAYP